MKSKRTLFSFFSIELHNLVYIPICFQNPTKHAGHLFLLKFCSQQNLPNLYHGGIANEKNIYKYLSQFNDKILIL